MTRTREKSGSKDREKDSLGQSINTTGGGTLGTSGMASGDDHGEAAARVVDLG